MGLGLSMELEIRQSYDETDALKIVREMLSRSPKKLV
jgi:hypothetical protein